MAPGSLPAGVARVADRDRVVGPATRVVLLVEGLSDRVAVEVLADRRGHDLAAAGVAVVPMGGATAVRAHAERFGPGGRGLTLGGLYDAAEERAVGRALERAGLGTGLDRAALEDLGFYGCDADLEDELIRALGVAGVEAVLDRQGDLASFRRFQAQPAQRDRPAAAQLHRFMGTRSGRKWQYAALLTDAVDLAAVPRPLDLMLSRALAAAG
ncbi:MAG TPA: TOPRIM nucleotidyl transferase/hydrolase domain-containing protein [Ilumatobacteraceae bacterium]|nr:TOPRIM nucleotidyl transferase/hydrolase domain-containing protein [Ilumatobacteraceae bacterium]